MGFLNSIIPKYLLLKKCDKCSYIEFGFFNITTKVIVNWWLTLANFIKRSFCRINLHIHYSVTWQSFTTTDFLMH